jgi:membrane carboxypeptidase/penicillin-binding protein PbpC|tara:strand:+ start:105 stop:458 length:354 start_codon:yes stop_codon:yes gene_type:complete
MEKFLYFMEQTDGAFDAAQDAVCYPVSSLQGFSADGTTTQLALHFSGVLGQDEDAYDVVTLTITANKQKEVITSIVQAITGAKAPHADGMIVVADDSNSVYVDSLITACSIAATAVD